MVTLCFEIEVRDEADGVDVCTKLMRVSGPGWEQYTVGISQCHVYQFTTHF